MPWEKYSTTGLDITDTKNITPTFLYDINPHILTEETNVVKCWWANETNQNGIFYAEATDVGIDFTQHSDDTPILSSAYGRPIVYKGSDGTLWMTTNKWGAGELDIWLHHSTDGVTITTDAKILSKGGVGEWDNREVCYGNIWEEDGSWFMLYCGCSTDTGAYVWATGVATADAVTGPWTKYAGNPVIRQGVVPGLGGSRFKDARGMYYIWTTTQPRFTDPWSYFIKFRSLDLHYWLQLPGIFGPTTYDEGVDTQATSDLANVGLHEIDGWTYLYYFTCRELGPPQVGFKIKVAKVNMPISALYEMRDG